jgi:outer membrane protein
LKRRKQFISPKITGLAASLFALSAIPVAAQTPVPVVPLTVPGAPAASATADVPARTFTLAQVLAIALNNNSSVRLAREKVIKAQQLINEANAGGLPQISVNIVDTLSSNKTYGTAAGGTNSSGTLPGGGQIPIITDTGGGNAGAVTSSGGGGTATGSGSSSQSSVSTTAAGSGGTGTASSGATNTTPSTSTFGTGGAIGTGTTGTTGTTGNGTTSTGTFGTTGPTAQVRSSGLDNADLPPIMQHYTAATSGKTIPHDTTGTGTGQQAGNGSLNSGNSGYNNNYSARVSVTQSIDIFNLVPAARDVESITRDFYVVDLDRIQNETALTAKNDFFNVLRDQEQVTVDEQQVTADTESVRVTQARVTAGAAAEYDLLTAQTTLSNAQQLLSSARNTLALAQVNLNNLLGIDPDIPLALQAPPLPPLTQTFDKNQLTASAFARRPELRQADSNIVIAQRLIKLAGVGQLPSVSIVGSGNYNGNVYTGTHSTASLSAVLGIPLYDGGTTHAKIKEAQSDLRSQQITREQLRQNVSVEVRQALSNINDAQTRASSATLGVTQAQEAFRLSNVRYQNGIGTILDVVNAQAQLAQARSNLLNAQYDYQTSLAQLTRALGGR